MMKNKDTRDILDVSSPAEQSYPEENMPKRTDRPTVSNAPQEGGYFLNKFLGQSNNEPTVDAQATRETSGAQEETAPENLPSSPQELRETIVAALQEIYDPEIPVNIYELGLIYDVEVDADFNAKVRMTLTTPHCPVAESMPGEVELKVAGVVGVKSSEVALVWEPPWDMSMMSDEARLELGLL